MKHLLLFTLTCISLFANITEQEKSFVQSKLPNTKCDKIQKSNISNLYECYLTNSDILYVEPYNELIFFGEIYTTQGANLTAYKKREWSNELQKQKLNLSQDEIAELKNIGVQEEYEKYNSEYELIVFKSLACPHCNNLTEWLRDKKINRYSLYPNTPQSKELLQKIDISNPDDRLKSMEAQGDKLGIMGVPYILIIKVSDKKLIDIVSGFDVKKLQEYIK